jgi:hypothetical protein
VQCNVAKWRELVGSAVVSDGRQFLNEICKARCGSPPEGKTDRFVGPVATVG